MVLEVSVNITKGKPAETEKYLGIYIIFGPTLRLFSLPSSRLHSEESPIVSIKDSHGP
jgi:hypothetical protein